MINFDWHATFFNLNTETPKQRLQTLCCHCGKQYREDMFSVLHKLFLVACVKGPDLKSPCFSPTASQATKPGLNKVRECMCACVRRSLCEWYERMPTVVPLFISVKLNLQNVIRPLVFSAEQTFFVYAHVHKPWNWGVWSKTHNSR